MVKWRRLVVVNKFYLPFYTPADLARPWQTSSKIEKRYKDGFNSEELIITDCGFA